MNPTPVTQTVKARQVVAALSRLTPKDRLTLVSDGIKSLARYARLLHGEAQQAYDAAPAAAELAGELAAELGAKAMILLDYIRPPASVAPQLPFYRHEAADVYEDYYHMHFGTFGEVQEMARNALAASYVEGDDHVLFDVDSNWSKLSRESRLYPDLIEEGGRLKWQTPVMRMIVTAFGPPLAHCLDLVSAMEQNGFVEPMALRILADVWGTTALTPASDHAVLQDANVAFAERCLSGGIVTDEATARYVVRELRFPLCGIALKVAS